MGRTKGAITKNRKAKTKALTGFRKPRVTRRELRDTNRITHANTIAIVERRYKVICMRRDGYTVMDIARALGVSQGLVSQDLTAVLLDTIQNMAETVEESRQLQVERLDALLKANMPFATKDHSEVKTLMDGSEIVVTVPPDPKFANTILNIEARRSRLLALDKPEQKEVGETGVRVYVGVNYDKV